jgi:Ulp1 family protease
MKRTNDRESPVSKATKQGMSLNIDDQVWIKRLFDLQDNIIEEQLENLVADFSAKILNLITPMMAEIKSELKNINSEMIIIKSDIQLLHEMNKLNIEEINQIKRTITNHNHRLTCIEKKLNM